MIPLENDVTYFFYNFRKRLRSNSPMCVCVCVCFPPVNYSNQGAALLAQHTTTHGLIDERRGQLGNEKEPTRHGHTPEKSFK